jgi:hypothetical protein
MSKKPVPVQVPTFDPAPLEKKLDTISIEYNAMWKHAIQDTYVSRDLLRLVSYINYNFKYVR